MRVADDQGQDTKTAVVGDPLTMVFEILDQVGQVADAFSLLKVVVSANFKRDIFSYLFHNPTDVKQSQLMVL